ncbi:radical SAM protein [Deferrisoma camini]|uniref:radical SAM protein n=1 Tax=Deferrisoma camini TaxID=1035120 RepID=UPI0004B3CF41|nr:radical SAM protein [Deferrisoma camini]
MSSLWIPETLDYVGPIYRPPSEARSIILQATVGCAHNRCTFCVSYKTKGRFRIKDRAVIEADLDKAARLYPGVKRLFVADGDALIMPMREWRWLLPAIRENLPWVERVGAYTTARAVRKKTDEDLRWLRENGLGILYLGLESGDDETLRYVKKDSDSAQMIEAARRIRRAGILLSVTVLLGIAPPGRSLEHARETGRVLTAMDPEYVGALSVIVCEGTELAGQVARGEHHVPSPPELLEELREMLAATHMTHGLFMANHASNYLPLKVRMPGEKEEALALLDAARSGLVPLRPEEHRAL